jgi:ATP-binding cassette subfamily B protein
MSKILMNQAPSNIRSSMGPPRAGVPGKIEKAKDPRNAFIRLLFYLKPFKRLLIIIFSLVLLYTLLGLAGPYLIGVAIDKFIYLKDIKGLGFIAVVMLLIYLLNNLFQVIANWMMSKVSQDALKQMRGDLFKHLQELSLSFFDRNPAGELMSRLTNDIDAINQAVSQNVTSLVASLLTMVGIIVAMFVLNSWLALVTLIVIPLIFWFTQFVARYTRKGFRDLQKGLGQLNGTMEESISGQKVIKAFRRNDSAIENFRLNNNLVYKAGVYANTYALLLMPITNVLGNFFVIIIAGFGGWLALKGLVTVGIIATFINYGQNFIQPLRQLANMYNSIQAALAGAERVFEILDTEVEVKDSPDAIAFASLKGDVEFDNVEFGYLKDVSIIKKMSIHASAGEMIALVGPTGAGKTTIINLLTRFYEINNGKISLDGNDIKSFRKADLRKQLGLVLQDTFLFSGTVMENIRYGRLEATDDEVIKAATIADADQFIRHLPKGYQTELSERASNLSQGQRQLLSIARAVLANPRILILDEATSSVDTRTEVRIQSALLRLMEGRTSFVIAHRLSTIRDANQVLVIDNGQVIEKGTFEKLISKRGFFYNLYVSQFKGIAI